MYADLHMHSTFSFDGKGSIDEMCMAAIERGIGSVAFTEHYDILPKDVKAVGDDDRVYYEQRANDARKAVLSAREKYGNKLNVIYAIELGQSHHDIDAARRFIAEHDFDFVLGSIHQTATTNYADYYYLDYSKQNLDELFDSYYKENVELVRSGMLDSLAHLDYPVRVMEGFIPAPACLSKYRDAVAEVLREVVSHNIALELNTNGRSRWFDRISPEPWVLKLYKDLGGSMVTTGSDSHSAKLVGLCIPEAAELAKTYGLKVITRFSDRKPVLD